MNQGEIICETVIFSFYVSFRFNTKNFGLSFLYFTFHFSLFVCCM